MLISLIIAISSPFVLSFFVRSTRSLSPLSENLRIVPSIHSELQSKEEKAECSKQTSEQKIEKIDDVPEGSVAHSSSSSSQLGTCGTWKQNGLTVAGGHGYGNQLNQLNGPRGIYVDDDRQCFYVADSENHRIVKWEYGAEIGQVVAGGNGQGNSMNQLDRPINVIVDHKTDSLIVCDQGNVRVVRWSCQHSPSGETIIKHVPCNGLTMDNNGDLYVSDWSKGDVRRWKIGEKEGTLVAGGNGIGRKLNQLNSPASLFVDREYSIYVSDSMNNRVVKWVKGAKEGIVVAGGQGDGSKLTQLSYPRGVTIDHLGNVYVADSYNHRIICWSNGSLEGRTIVGGNGKGQGANQFHRVTDLSFNRQGNLYVVDIGNDRVQKFEIDLK